MDRQGDSDQSLWNGFVLYQTCIPGYSFMQWNRRVQSGEQVTRSTASTRAAGLSPWSIARHIPSNSGGGLGLAIRSTVCLVDAPFADLPLVLPGIHRIVKDSPPVPSYR
jgi:hypothetical protein